MIGIKRIFPECCADTLLVQQIFQRGLPRHLRGISKVSAALDHFKNDTLFVIGVVDDDKTKNVPTFLKTFEIINKTDDLIVLKDSRSERHLIKIVPAFEKWIWNVSTSCDIDPIQYGYKTWLDIKDITKTEAVFDNSDFKKFLNAVIDKNPPPIQTLRFWLSKVL